MPPRRAFPTLGDAEPFGGRVHLECPIDIQTTLQTRDHRRIERVARAHTERLAASAGGGFVAGYSVSNEALGLDPQYLETAARTCLQRGVRAWRRGPQRRWPPHRQRPSGGAMEYRPLGDSGLSIPTVTLGAWSFGSKAWANLRPDEECARVVAAALEHGITLLDTAHFYDRSQEIVGKALAALGSHRRQMRVATKGAGDRASLRQQCENSLRLLGVETIDLYYIHGPRKGLPVSEQIGYLAGLRQEGKIRAIGVSNFRLSQHQQAYAAVPFQASQPCYGPLWHEIEENGVGAWCRERGVAVLPFSPLAQGLLTGKYRRLDEVPQDYRSRNLLFQPGRFPLGLRVVEELARIGARYGRTVAQTAIAWCLGSPDVTSPIVGARSVEQVAENAGGAGWAMSSVEWRSVHDLGRAALDGIDRSVNIWGDPANWGT